VPAALKRQGAQVAVAVVSWNTRDLLARCLRSLEPEHAGGRAEVWVVDNGSSDGSPEMVREGFPWVGLLEPDRNLGYGQAVNLVAERTAAPWLAASNADVELRPGALEALLSAGEADGRTGIVAPRLLLPDGTTQHSVYSFPTLPFTLLVNLPVQLLTPRLADRLCLMGHWNPARARYVPWAVGAFLLIRREAFEAAGGFDPGQWMYAEDLDLGWRVNRAGYRTRFEPHALVTHAEGTATAQAFGQDRRERFMAATYAWMARRRGLPLTWAVAAVNCVGSGIRALWYSVLAPFAPTFAARRHSARVWLRSHRTGIRSARRMQEWR